MTPHGNFAHPHRGERSERAPVVTRHIDAKPEPAPADIPARIECFGAFRPADPVPCERPKTKKGRPGKASPLPDVSHSLGGSVSRHDPNRTTKE